MDINYIPNFLPNSLTSLKYSHCDHLIHPNFSLPNSITSLEIHNKINSTSIPNPLPINLKSITLRIYVYKETDLSLTEWPKSLETIYIDNYKNDYFYLFKNLSTDFFIKYFKTLKE